MKSDGTKATEEPRLGRILTEDLRRKDLWDTFRKDFRDLRAFYINDAQQARLQSMGWFKRWAYSVWWLFKNMLLKLTPLRRLMIFVGIIFTLIGERVRIENHQVQTQDWHLFGGALLLLVLMLELKDKLLATDELEAGRRIQQALMPEPAPEVQGWSIWLHSRPANEVGGDLVDFLRIDDSRVGIALGDVSGKGLKAALLMAKLQAIVRALAPDFSSLAQLASKINQIFHRDTLPGIFASLLYVELKPSAAQIRYVNAGHHPPILLSAEKTQEMAKGEAALGLAAQMHYTEQSIDLKAGEVFFAYSDGLIEARNEAGEFYGVDRLLRLLPTLVHLTAPEMGRAILDSLSLFTREARAADDLSIVILKRA